MLSVLPWQQEAAVRGKKTPAPPSPFPTSSLFWVDHAWLSLQRTDEQLPQGWGSTGGAAREGGVPCHYLLSPDECICFLFLLW